MPECKYFDDCNRQGSCAYISFITLATLGRGDSTSVHPLARMFVVVQALFGQLCPAPLLACLVSLELPTGRPVRPRGTTEHLRSRGTCRC